MPWYKPSTWFGGIAVRQSRKEIEGAAIVYGHTPEEVFARCWDDIVVARTFIIYELGHDPATAHKLDKQQLNALSVAINAAAIVAKKDWRREAALTFWARYVSGFIHRELRAPALRMMAALVRRADAIREAIAAVEQEYPEAFARELRDY